MAGPIVLGLGADSKIIALGYGGGLAPVYSPSGGDTELAAPIGVTISSSQELYVGGRQVTSPVTLSEEGLYEVKVVYGGNSITWLLAVVDPASVVARIEGFVAPSNLAVNLSSPYAKVPGSQPGTAVPFTKLRVSTNKAVVMAVGIELDGTRQKLGRICALGAGTWESTALALQASTNQVKLYLEMIPQQLLLQLPSLGSGDAPLPPVLSYVSLLPTTDSSPNDRQFSDPSLSSNTAVLVNKVDPWDDSTFLTMSQVYGQFTSYRCEDFTIPTDFRGIAYVDVLLRVGLDPADSTPKAVCAPYILDPNSRTRYRTPLQAVTAIPGSFVTLSSRFLINPITGAVWSPGDLVGGAVRFGVERYSKAASLRVSALNVRVYLV